MRIFLEISGAIFWANIIGLGLLLTAQRLLKWWHFYREFKTFPERGGDDEVYWSAGVEVAMRRLVARKRAVAARRAQEAEARERAHE